jgi:hypothetical protein
LSRFAVQAWTMHVGVRDRRGSRWHGAVLACRDRRQQLGDEVGDR